MKKVIFIVILVLIGSIGYISYEKFEKDEDSSTIVLYGNVDIRNVALGFRVLGRVDKLNFDEGDIVDVNDTLATLDSKPFEDTLNLHKAELSEAVASYNNAKKNYDRVLKLYKSKTISQSNYDDSLAAYHIAKAKVEALKASVELAQTALNDTKLISPSHGTILTRVHEKGSIVGVGEPIFILGLDTPVWIRTYVDEPDLGYIYAGQKAIIKTDSNSSYIGHIGFISPEAEFTPKSVQTTKLRTQLVYRIRVIVDNANYMLKQGMPVTVEINKESR